MSGPMRLEAGVLPESFLHGTVAKVLVLVGEHGHMVVDLAITVTLLEDHHVLDEERRLPCLIASECGASALTVCCGAF